LSIAKEMDMRVERRLPARRGFNGGNSPLSKPAMLRRMKRRLANGD